MVIYKAITNYEHELIELIDGEGKLCAPTGEYVKKADYDADLAAAEERGRREAVKEAYRGIFPFGDEADTVSTLLVRNILESVSPGYDALLPEKGKEWPS